MLWQMLPWLRVWGLSQQTVKLAEYWLPTTLRNLSGYQRSNWRTGWLTASIGDRSANLRELVFLKVALVAARSIQSSYAIIKRCLIHPQPMLSLPAINRSWF